MSNDITSDRCQNSLDRRSFLKCSAWAGTGVLWTVVGGVPTASALIGTALADEASPGGFSFAQISDTHIGFNKPANGDVVGTATEAINKIRALPSKPSLLLHTGDLSHFATPDQLDAAEKIVAGAGIDTRFVPGEHDITDIDTAKAWAARFNSRQQAQGWGWHSFTQSGVHFVGLVNVVDRNAEGSGTLGAEQLAWLQKDLSGLPDSTPIVIYSHIPLWTVFTDWGWATTDSAQMMALVKRFGSVTVLNGHIHQIVQKVEGNVTFHSARSTAYPQPVAGTAPASGPVVLPAGQLRTALGVSNITLRQGSAPLALTDYTLAAI